MRGLDRCLMAVAGLRMDIGISIALRIMGGRFTRLILARERRLVIRIIIVFLRERGRFSRLRCRLEKREGNEGRAVKEG